MAEADRMGAGPRSMAGALELVTTHWIGDPLHPFIRSQFRTENRYPLFLELLYPARRKGMMGAAGSASAGYLSESSRTARGSPKR